MMTECRCQSGNWFVNSWEHRKGGQDCTIGDEQSEVGNKMHAKKREEEEERKHTPKEESSHWSTCGNSYKSRFL